MPNQPKTPARGVRVPNALWLPALDKAQQSGETVTAVLIRALHAYVAEDVDALHAAEDAAARQVADAAYYAPRLRPGEHPAPPTRYGFRPNRHDAPDRFGPE